MGVRPVRLRRRTPRKRHLAAFPSPGEVLRGSLIERYRRCGKPGCRCARAGEKGHGPAHYLTVTVAAGKTLTVYVRARDVERVEACLENFRRARAILEELSTQNRIRLQEGTLFPGGSSGRINARVGASG